MDQLIRHRAGAIYFIFACALYLFGSTFLDASGLVYLSLCSLTLAFFMGVASAKAGRTGVTGVVFMCMLIFAMLNLMVSTNPSESALRWLFWFVMFIAFGLLATEYDESVDRSLSVLLPFGFVMIWFAKYAYGNSEGLLARDKIAALHLSAFFANLTIATGLFHPRIFWRLFFCAIGTYGVLFSGSRAAFLFFPLLFIVPGLYYFRTRLAAFIGLLLPISLLAVVFLNENLMEKTFGLKTSNTNKLAVVAAENSASERGFLRELGIEMILDRPLGYGYGDTYIIPGKENKSRGTNFHNGYVNVGAAMGLPFLLLYIGFNLWLIWSLYVEERAPRLFRHLFLSILVCTNIRAITEDFTLFDLGNPSCYLVVYLSLVYLNKRHYVPVQLRR